MEVDDLDELYEHLPFGHRLAAPHADNELHLRSWNQPALGPELHVLIHHSAIADALEPHLGPNTSFNGGYHLRPKMSNSQAQPFRFIRIANIMGNYPNTPILSLFGFRWLMRKKLTVVFM